MTALVGETHRAGLVGELDQVLAPGTTRVQALLIVMTEALASADSVSEGRCPEDFVPWLLIVLSIGGTIVGTAISRGLSNVVGDVLGGLIGAIAFLGVFMGGLALARVRSMK